MTQKILAAHAGLESVYAGQLISIKLDLVLGNDITAPVAIQEFQKTGRSVFDNRRIALVMDHFTPNKDIRAAEQCKYVRAFARKHDIVNFFDVGQMGIEHALLPEKGLVAPGEAVIGADSHTCTYGALGAFSTGVGSTDMAGSMATGKVWLKTPPAIRFNLIGELNKYVGGKDVILHIIGKIGVGGALYKSMEFGGPGLASLSMDDRLCVANMAVEAGGKNGVFEVDEQTVEYIRQRTERPFKIYAPDTDADYEITIDINLSALTPTVALPHLPERTKAVEEIREKVKIDQVVIGSCTNGRISDLRAAADILVGKRVSPDVRAIVFPAPQAIYLQALEEGLIRIFVESGCAVSTPTCGPCLGGHCGILAAGERCVATTNRNFVGRMGHVKSEVYLAGPAVAAASAITGYIASPYEL
jgi:3-isopropylmalate/(R)-2-methylmalate dehydratase large subunit